jgi:hypothetical protein
MERAIPSAIWLRAELAMQRNKIPLLRIKDIFCPYTTNYQLVQVMLAAYILIVTTTTVVSQHDSAPVF